MKKITFLISLFVVLFTTNSHSQNKIFDNWSLNLNAGIPMFWGDVESTFSDKVNVSTAFGVILSKKLNPFLDLRGELIIGSVAGSQPKYNREFKADFYDYYIGTSLNFLNLIYGENPCRKLNAFGIVGLGMNQYRSALTEISTGKIIRNRGFRNEYGGAGEEWETESYVAAGIGFSYRLDSRFELTAENQWHVLNTDLLDATKGRFQYDILSYTSVGITYKFNLVKNPGNFVDCTRGGTSKGKLDDGIYRDGNNTIIIEKVKWDTVTTIINNSEKVKTIERRLDSLEKNCKSTTPEPKMNGSEARFKEIEIRNTTPDTSKYNALEKRIRDLEGRTSTPVANNNVAPANNDKLIEMENRIKELENQKNNNISTPNNNNVALAIDQDAIRRSILKAVMDSINNMPKPKATYTQPATSTGNVNVDNLSLLSVYFDFNKANIKPSEISKIENVAQLMLKNPGMRILVSGHCDRRGDEPYNDGLSKRRANAVAKMLVKKYGINADRITKEYDGKKNPLSIEHSLNRRVDFIKL